MKRKRSKRLSLFALTSIVFLTIFQTIFTTNAYAFTKNESTYTSNLTDDEISNLFELKTGDVLNPWDWISKNRTYIIYQQDSSDDSSCFWWNVPNLQQSGFNNLYKFVIDSGYGNGSGVLATEHNDSGLVSVPKRKEAKTALQKYGFNIPSPAYVGERPLVTISTTEVLKPDSIPNAVSRLWSGIKDFISNPSDGFEIVKAPTDRDLNTLLYASPRDYVDGDKSFQYWADNNWSNALDIIKPGQVLVNDADDSGVSSDGNYYIWKAIIEAQDGKLNDRNLSGKQICQYLKEICGSKYSEVCENIVKVCNEKGTQNNNKPIRLMPYDKSKLTSKDKEIIGVTDPRSDMQKSTLETGLDKKVTNWFKSFILKISSEISELTIAINGVANFTFMENNGIDPTILWTNSIMQIIGTIMAGAFCFYAVKSAIDVFKNSGAAAKGVLKLFGIFVLICFVFGMFYNTDSTYNFIKNTSTKIFNISNVSFTSNERLSSLYGTGDNSEKENTSLWLPYFNLWTSYNTQHSLIDNSQIIEKNNESQPETVSVKIPKIDGVEQTIWSTILAESFTSNSKYSNDVYRVVDHFMAPRLNQNVDVVNLFNQNNGTNGIDGKITKSIMSQNENYNGDIQSTIDLSAIPFQVIILFITIFKVLVFLEFIFNIAMLLINISLTSVNMKNLKNTIRELLGNIILIVILNVITSLIIWMCLVVDGIAGLIISISMIYVIFKLFQTFINGRSFLVPKFITPVKKQLRKIQRMFEE